MTEKQLERRIKEVYSEATNDLQRKWDDYFERRSKDIAETENALKQAKIDQNQELSSKLEKELEQKKYNLTLGNKQYKDMVAQTTKRIAEANQIAVAYANDAAATFYTQGFNETIPEIAEAGVRFDMQDEATVRRLIKDGDIQMPKRKLDIPKDERWNTKQINSRVLQGIIQGESMDKIANRLQPIMDNNRASAMRNARTLVNGAENLGRMDRAHELEGNGVILHKVWIATGDERTRDIHLEIDGQEVELDEPFIDGNGNELQYPCDPNAEPETVYNCRCTYIRKVVGFVKEDGTVEEVDYEAETEQHKEEVEQEQERREEEQAEKAEETADEIKEETPKEPEFVFEEAKTIEEAERFISQYVDSSKFGATGVDYTGINLETANRINRTLASLQTTFNASQFGGISAPAGNTKTGKKISNATAAYSPIRDSFFLNRSAFKGDPDAHLRQEQEAIADIYAHPEKYDLSKISAYSRRIIEAGEESGRTTVPTNVEEVIYHEYGHRLESRIPREMQGAVQESRERYGASISGYATTENSEYIAESFCCYMKGEEIDPTMEALFDDMKEGKI